MRLMLKTIPKYLLSEDVNKAIEGTEKQRDRLILNMLWHTGLRVSELISIRLFDISFDAHTLTTKTLKRKNHIRVIPINPELETKILLYAAEDGIKKDDPIFPITRRRVYDIVKKSLIQSGIDPAISHPHTLRHSFAIHCIKNGVSVVVLNEWLGHANIENTMIYSRIMAIDSKEFYDKISWG